MKKFKGFSAAVKMRYLLFVFAAAVLVALPTRVYQLLALVDVTNGFYKESDITIPVLYAVAVVFGILFLVLSYISKEVPSPKLPAAKNIVLGITSFVMVGGIAWDMVSFIKEAIPGGTGNISIFISLLSSNLKEAGGVFAFLQFVFAFFAIIYFTVFGISHLNGRASYKEFKLLALSPLCWVMTMLISKVMVAISFVKVSELLFEIFMCVFMMLFFLTFARISSGVFSEDSMWGIYGYGLVGAMLAAIVSIPRLVVFAVGINPVEGYDFNFAHFTMLVFVLSYIFASLGIGFKDGLKNRKAVSDMELLDDEAIIKKADDALLEAVEIAEEVIEEPAEEIVEEIIEEPAEEIIEEAIEEPAEEIVEEIIEEPAEEIVEEAIEEPADGIVEEIIEEPAEEIIEEAIEEPADEIVEEIIEEPADEYAPISLADLKKRQSKE